MSKVEQLIDEKKLVLLVEQSKAEYPNLPDCVIHAACVDHLMYPNQKEPRYKTDKDFNAEIEKVKALYDNKVFQYKGVTVDDNNLDVNKLDLV